MNTEESPKVSADVPLLGALLAVASVLLMIVASVWVWPSLADGVEAPQRDGSSLVVPGWPFAVLMPALLTLVAGIILLAQPIRRRVAHATRVPLWKEDPTNKWSASMALIAISVTFLGLHALVLSLAADVGVTLGLNVLGFCLGLLLIVVGNYMGKLAPLTDEQRAVIPTRLHGFADGYRDGFHRGSRLLRWPFVALGVLSCVLAFLVPWVAIFIPVLAALAMCVPVGLGIIAGLEHRKDPAPR